MAGCLRPDHHAGLALHRDAAPARHPAGRRLILPAPADGPVEDLQRELRRLLDRCVALGPTRLERAGDDGRSPADRVRPVLQDLADRAAALEGRAPRPVPVLAVHALGDQLAVLVADVLRAARRRPPVSAADEELASAHAVLVDLRRSL